jgi:hypothetical protein
MAYDEGLAQRVREALAGRAALTEKKMFGGIAFMLRGNMCCGIVGDTLMARVGPQQHAEALTRPHTRPMDFTGKPMMGYLYIAPEGISSDEDLAAWVSMCEDFVRILPGK